MEILPVLVGLPEEFATELRVRVLSFDTTSDSVTLFYSALNNLGVELVDGNIVLTPSEWATNRSDNILIEDVALSKLGLIRASTTTTTTTVAPTTTTTTEAPTTTSTTTVPPTTTTTTT